MTPAPAWAVLAWCDDTSVYIELPCLDGSFHRLSFPLSEGGLSRALNLLRSRPKPTSPTYAKATPPSRFTADQLAMAMKILRETA